LLDGIVVLVWLECPEAVWRRLVSAVAQRFGGLLFGLLEMTLVKFYQYVVDPAPPGSWPVRLFARLARGPLKCAFRARFLCSLFTLV